MSRSKYVSYGENVFWVFDVELNIFLKFLIDVGIDYLKKHNEAWLSSEIEDWQFIAIVSDIGLGFDCESPSHKIKTIIELIQIACQNLSTTEFITATEIENWNILDGKGIFSRGIKKFDTKHLIELGNAIIALLKGNLQTPPNGGMLYFNESSFE